MSDVASTSVKPARRKRGEGYIQDERKKRRSEGKNYVNKRGRLVQAKQPHENKAVCKCKYQCTTVPHEHQVKLFHSFYAMKDNSKHNSYLMGLLSVTEVKRRRHGTYEDSQTSRRQATVYFQVPNGSGHIIQVCRQTFLHIFQITKRRIEALVALKKKGDIVYVERRGNATQFRTFTPDDESLVIEQVNSLPREQSHYSRGKSSKEYLSQDLNISRLYRVFKEEHPQSNVTYRYYYQTFNRKFPNLSFHPPRSDTCATCDLLHMQTRSKPNSNEAKMKLQLHHRKAERARTCMKEDTQESQLPTSDTCTLAIDLEQVLSLPTLTHSDMYYLRQLSCYNLCLHVADNNKGNMFLWHEGITGRGGNEIVSCILKAITSCKLTYKRKLIIWSDNCVAQNKNKMLLFLWMYLIAKGHIDEVNQKYLISGHSYLSCDRDFAQIEKRKRLEKCEVPFDLVKMIVSATPKNPFIVTVMNPEDFFDFKAAADQYITTTKLKISQAQWIRVDKNHPGVVTIKQTLNDLESWKRTKILKKNVTPQVLQNMELPRLQCTSRISSDKRENLTAMIQFVSEENRGFFINLCNENVDSVDTNT